MTREEIEKATLTWTLKGRDWRAEMVDFALDVVRRRDEEVLNIVKLAIRLGAIENITEAIRESKP